MNPAVPTPARRVNAPSPSGAKDGSAMTHSHRAPFSRHASKTAPGTCAAGSPLQLLDAKER